MTPSTNSAFSDIYEPNWKIEYISQPSENWWTRNPLFDELMARIRELERYPIDMQLTKASGFDVSNDDSEIGVSSKEFNEFMEEFEIKRGD